MPPDSPVILLSTVWSSGGSLCAIALLTSEPWSLTKIMAQKIILVEHSFKERIVELAHQYHLNIRLAYYPPYYSKYNPIERTWAVLEKHWNGSLLDEIETVLNFAKTMTWKGKHPQVTLIEQTYEKGVRLQPKEMEQFEAQVQRLSNQGQEKMPDLGKWFVDISWDSA